MSKLLKKALREHQRGRYREARDLYRKILRGTPDDLDGHYLLGTLYAEHGHLEDAEQHLRRAAALNPASAQVSNNLGNVLKRAGRLDEAVASYTRALEIEPELGQACVNLGNLLSRERRYAEALPLLERARVLSPDTAQVRLDLAVTWLGLREHERALALFRNVLEDEPDNPTARHFVAALSGETTDAPASGYVRDLFDYYAGTFDRHLTGELGYRTPASLRALLTSVAGEGCRFAGALDLGCGTGLSGEAFRDLAERMTGVDLSPGMLAEAREKGVYDELAEGDAVGYLEAAEHSYELMVACDVLTYLGALDALFAAAAGRLAVGGYLLCSVEALDEAQDYVLRASGRYAHAPAYVTAAAAARGLRVVGEESVELRRENDAWVDGRLYAMTANSAEASGTR